MRAVSILAQFVAADTAPKIMLLLALLVSIFGIGVVVVGRRNSAATSQSITQLTSQPTSESLLANDLSVRDRLTKVRATFASAISIALTSSSITQQTWDDLEEALLRADVGVASTARVLVPLRELVKTKRSHSQVI